MKHEPGHFFDFFQFIFAGRPSLEGTLPWGMQDLLQTVPRPISC